MRTIIALILLAATAQAADITIAVTVRAGGTTNRETAQINNTNNAARVIAFWQALGTNSPAKNAALAIKDEAIARGKDAELREVAASADAEKRAKIDAAAARLATEPEQ